MSFKKLLGELQDLAKSQAGNADDANIQAAGATGGDSNNGGEGGGEAGASAGASADAGGGAEGGAAGATGGEGGEGGGDGEDGLVKSFEVELADGSKAKAIDPDSLIKSMTDMHGRLGTVESDVGEALGVCVTLIKSLVADNAKMRADLKTLSKQGTGRVTLLSIAGKNTEAAPGAVAATLAKSDADKGMKPQEFLAKAESAFNGKALSGRDLALAESHINRGEAVPMHIIQAVMGYGAKA